MNWDQIKVEGIRVAESKGLEYCSSAVSRTELRRFARDQGVDRLELHEMDDDALVVQRPDGHFSLFLNKHHQRVRHRFSVAHELAHLLLSAVLASRPIHRRRFSPSQDPEGQQIEYLCNAMASSILMPRQRVIPIINRSGTTAACIPEVAETFDVSFEAAARRYVKVVPESCALVFWTLENGWRARNLKRPVCSDDLGHPWLEITPSSPHGRISASEALVRDKMVVSRESVVLLRGRGRSASTTYNSNVKVESFGRGRGSSRHVLSFVYVPPQQAKL